VLVMAVIQVAGIILAMAAARRIGQVAERLEHELRPVVDNLTSISADAARASGLAARQMERADRLFEQLGRRGEQVLGAIPGLLGSAGKGFAFVSIAKAALAAIQELRRGARRRPAPAEEDDALFIG
jgi:hypothetical protein